jgi:hypothetical protein
MNTQWRRRRRGIVGRPRRDATDLSFGAAVLTLAAGALLVLTTGLWVMLELEQLGPSVGGIIVFRPDPVATERWTLNATIAVPAAARVTGRDAAEHCVLNPLVMAGHGGSLIIEARLLSRPPEYRVHWSGGHTDTGSHDCGITADLVLARTDLMRLANVAGGLRDGMTLIGP